MAGELWNVPSSQGSRGGTVSAPKPKNSTNSQKHKCIKEIKCIRS